ncbi:MAG: hypothetical protein EBR95_05330 [Verrucomicrobia bacterium]|nr:hypothetical protein [Verrucomicrobiota bacterium]
MEQIVYLVTFVALAATVYGKHLATRNSQVIEGDERPRNLAETTVIGLVIALCLLITAEVFLRWETRIASADALWTMIPAVLWSVGMFIAHRHPLDRTSVGTGLATLLPHIYQTLLAETQLASASLSVLCVAVAMVVAVRREPATHP